MASRPEPVVARNGFFLNISMTVVAFLMVAAAALYIGGSDTALAQGLSDPRFMMFILLGIAMAYYGTVGLRRALDRSPQVTIDADGIRLGLGRNLLFTWDQIQWVRLNRVAVRANLHIGIVPETFVGSNLGLAQWNLDDALKPIRGIPAAFALRDNGLDTRASALLEGVRRFRPDLIRS